uniref:Uncharacterized protein n=1 Tax=Hyaloperonospora arabidopsidis (strain Emoy2) TaxID=559515 RepID=M4B827_HYAAE
MSPMQSPTMGTHAHAHPHQGVWVANGRVGVVIGERVWAFDKWLVVWLGMGGHWAG